MKITYKSTAIAEKNVTGQVESIIGKLCALKFAAVCEGRGATFSAVVDVDSMSTASPAFNNFLADIATILDMQTIDSPAANDWHAAVQFWLED